MRAGNRIAGIESILKNKGKKFTTYDKDYDKASTNCAVSYLRGGWWYDDCGDMFLNALYHQQEDVGFKDGVLWRASTRRASWGVFVPPLVVFLITFEILNILP